MKQVWIAGIAAAMAAFAVACGGGSSDKTATPAPKATTAAATVAATKPAATTAAAESPAEAAELAKDIETVKEVMADVIAKAKAGDVQGTKDAEGAMDDPLEAIIKALKAVDPALADSIEERELAIEHEADASTTDLAVIAKAAGEIPALLDQAATKLKLPASTSADAPTAAELTADIKAVKEVMADVIAKAKAGDVQGTKDAEGAMDDPLEAIIKAVKAVDPALADSIE
ncbi:MAG: hypothetical protein HY874_08160, partial [Chloroflexi bacterium]|nr:hypothetical protein [Chloroflexota bacterium]